MWKKLIQAIAITSALYLVMGMSRSPISRSATQLQLSDNFQYPLNALNVQP